MFEQATLSYGPATKRVWTTCLGVTGQALLVTGMILTPMIWPDVLPKAQTFLVGPLMVPPLPPQGPVVKPRGTPAAMRPISARNYPALWEPPRIPTFAPILEDPPDGPAAVVGDGQGPSLSGIEGGVPGGIPRGGPMDAPPPRIIEHLAATPRPETPTITRLKVSQLDAARIRHRVQPVYPPMAIQMHISGTVELRGVIGTDGRIRELKVLRGHPFLVKSALEAVSQWIYEPTRLNGETVEVDAPILVTFHLH